MSKFSHDDADDNSRATTIPRSLLPTSTQLMQLLDRQ